MGWQALLDRDQVPAIMGPTATGKTALALWLAESLPVEIISVDSALVYRGMDIGTAKPTAGERARVPHHLIDILDPADSYSASRFVADVRQCVAEIRQRGRLPLLVGGTMMYFNALQHGLAPLPEADPELRAELTAQWQQDPHVLRAELERVDAEAAARIAPADPQRTIRALEVYRLTGTPLSVLQRNTRPQVDFTLMKFGLIPARRQRLHQRIERRFRTMLAQGFEQEVRALYTRGDLTPELPAIRSVGYRQMWGYLAGEYDWDTMVHKGIVATRQLAKRQLTWLRKEAEMLCFDPYAQSMETIGAAILQRLNG
ncbi:MAG TPA: tRNA (adenosine(37)-N6)-dimethylallyltransferase MiaA [Piscirickettsiaceae bacterium]|nr:tRNA (adenosine(37)-N6)-dimethylallyltransferase MiaA [Piscirickettsiaceae bacterium]HIQ39688.1 tRNA (adenosine(37)-N6)-dimethylallyltransferase MiaA [Sulfurivirga caldicuralii]